MTHESRSIRTIGVDQLARVEGEGSLSIEIAGGELADVRLDIFEPPRYFEALLRGRDFREAPDITARICGICPVAYQISACLALEDACGVTVRDEVRRLRRLLYCGEWIKSHALHVYLLHAPDFLGLDDAVQLAERDAESLKRGLGLKALGNKLMETVGGRAIHPVNVRVGGFYSAPSPAAIAELADPLRRGLEAARTTVEWVSRFDFPELDGDYRFVALEDPPHYPIDAGRPATSDGLSLSAGELAELVVEEHVGHSTALHARLRDHGPYLTGPLARYALNAETLPPLATEAAADARLGPACRNPFRSIVVRSVELLAACEEALELVENYEPPEPASDPVPLRDGHGTGASEAPRGLLFHSYEIEDGIIRSARIVPPTSQNQLSMEADLWQVARHGLDEDLDDDDLRERCERAVRNHDPCISCAAHFLDVKVNRR